MHHPTASLTLTILLVAAGGLGGCGDTGRSAEAGTAAVGEPYDFGLFRDRQLAADSAALFGIDAPLAASAAGSTARTVGQEAADLIELAGGLQAAILTRRAANHTDMFAFWPADVAEPTHLIACVEGRNAFLRDTGGDGVFQPGDVLNPSLQAIRLSDGAVTTLVRGMSRCDGVRPTPWGTLVATEEPGDGGAYELLLPADPAAFREATVTDRATGRIVFTADGADAGRVAAKRPALPTMGWEGFDVLPSGVVIGGDELRPGTDGADADGGALYKFVPARAHDGSAVSALGDSPLVAGRVYALRVSCTTGTQYGQGCEVGNGGWVGVTAATARADANAGGATGYYRPEDLHLDPTYGGPGVRFCWANTGSVKARHYGEVLCGVDRDPLSVEGNGVVVNRFMEGDGEFNAVDNLAFQPVSGLLAVTEDHDNGDVWLCLPDGADRDIKTDGCVRILSIKDRSAEPTGFIFSPDGTAAYLSIQHSEDPPHGSMDDADGYGTDDVLLITGFRAPIANRR